MIKYKSQEGEKKSTWKPKYKQQVRIYTQLDTACCIYGSWNIATLVGNVYLVCEV